MMPIPVIAIFDIGKTNKKFFLFNEKYAVVYEKVEYFTEIMDDDGFPCEDLKALSDWINQTINLALSQSEFDIRALNFSAYGASFVYIDKSGHPIGHLYNYLKPFDETLRVQFFQSYGHEQEMAVSTASPLLGNLNSGWQLYGLKYRKPQLYASIQYALHLPQYLSYLISHKPVSDITSIGCHTLLWDFGKKDYHFWVKQEGIEQLLPPIFPTHKTVTCGVINKTLAVGIGLHDSSAALIPYQVSFQEPFVLISTGTWCISLNPFNHHPLTPEELEQDCLCYYNYTGTPVKASRLFAGYIHEQQLAFLASHFSVAKDHYQEIQYSKDIHLILLSEAYIPFVPENISENVNYSEAYHRLIYDFVIQQQQSTQLVLSGTAVSQIFVDGGFAKNELYMHMLARAFPGMEVYAATLSQASAIGAAMAIHTSWNTMAIPEQIISLKKYYPLPLH